MLVNCQYCGSEIEKTKGYINRALKRGYGLFCDKTCSGLSRRLNKSDIQKKEEKRLYDIQYRTKNKNRLKKQKSEYYKTDAGRACQKRNRVKRKEAHNEYCRRPEYVKYKKEYDKKYRAQKQYGEFWESALILKDLTLDLDRIQADFINGTFNKAQTRKRGNNY